MCVAADEPTRSLCDWQTATGLRRAEDGRLAVITLTSPHGGQVSVHLHHHVRDVCPSQSLPDQIREVDRRRAHSLERQVGSGHSPYLPTSLPPTSFHPSPPSLSPIPHSLPDLRSPQDLEAKTYRLFAVSTAVSLCAGRVCSLPTRGSWCAGRVAVV